jgi:hypothetical protein
MKPYLTILLLFVSCTGIFSQNTFITLRPGPDKGKDCIINDYFDTRNYGDEIELNAFAWTDDGEFFISRFLLEFDLSKLPDKNLKSAKLSLYCNWESTNTMLSSGENESRLYMVTEPWDEDIVTWSTRPHYRTDVFANVPATQNNDDDILDIDVTEIVSYWILHPEENHGFLFKLITEEVYACIVMSSSDHAYPERWPKLELEFTDCPVIDPDFHYSVDGKQVTVKYHNDEVAGLCRWNFDDGAIISGDSLVHTYLEGGNYNITLEYITEDCGVFTKTKQICICENVPWFEQFINDEKPNRMAFYPGVGIASINLWDFGDGWYSNEEFPIHDFREIGEYNVCLYCINECGETDTICRNIEISTLGIFDDGRNYQLYPNPADEYVKVLFPLNYSGDIQLTSLTGETIRHQRMSNTNEFSIDVSDLKSGVYFIRFLSDNEELLFEKLVVY